MTNRELNQALLVGGLSVLSLVTLWLVPGLVLGLFGIDRGPREVGQCAFTSLAQCPLAT